MSRSIGRKLGIARTQATSFSLSLASGQTSAMFSAKRALRCAKAESALTSTLGRFFAFETAMSTIDATLASKASAPLLRPWCGTEREDLFAAIARHRRAAWQVTAVCALAYLLLALVVAIPMAPLLYSLVGLDLDLINLIIPTPDLLP
jgi:hypothetical protein